MLYIMDDEEVQRWFCELYNAHYTDEPTLSPNRIQFEYVSDAYGKCTYVGSFEYSVYLGINPDHWVKSTREEQIRLLIHELGHTRDHAGKHSPDFWEEVIDIYRSAINSTDTFSFRVEWDDVARRLVDNPSIGKVDNRSETVYERRKKIADALGVPYNENDLWTDMPISQWITQESRKRPIDEIEHTLYDKQAICDWYRSGQTSMSIENEIYMIDPIPIVERGESYTTIDKDGDMMCSIFTHTDRGYVQTIPADDEDRITI